MEQPTNQRNNFLQRILRWIGPAIIVAAGIIGPGTVTTASSVGAQYGFLLVWCAILSPIVAYIEHYPAIAFPLKTNLTLIEGVKTYISPVLAKILILVICFMALAYQTANCIGAAMALNLIFPQVSMTAGIVIFGVGGTLLSLTDRIGFLEKISAGIVAVMVLAFAGCLLASRPSIPALVNGMVPRIPAGATLLVVGLVGTTACSDTPFGMSGLTKRDWKHGLADLPAAKKDLRNNMIIIGVCTVGIMALSATVLHPQGILVNSAADMAAQLTPFLGYAATVIFALGLAAAGFSSVIYNCCVYPFMVSETWELTGKAKTAVDRIGVLLIGLFPVFVSILLAGQVPTFIIVTAQAFNVMLLPFTVLICLYLMNRKDVMGEAAFTKKQNIAYGAVTLFALVIFLLGLPSVADAFRTLFTF